MVSCSEMNILVFLVGIECEEGGGCQMRRFSCWLTLSPPMPNAMNKVTDFSSDLPNDSHLMMPEFSKIDEFPERK